MSLPSPDSRLILASGSPYRRELLARLHLPFEVVVSAVNEQPAPGESPEDTALRLAEDKAAAVLARHPDSLVIGSDQVATLDGLQIGKPGSHANAMTQLQSMRGRTVVFHTALCLLDGRTGASARTSVALKQRKNVRTAVTFRHLSDDQLERYLELEQPYDCAGSAKIEGLGIVLVERVESDDPSALIGLPLIALTTMLRDAGIELPAPSPV